MVEMPQVPYAQASTRFICTNLRPRNRKQLLLITATSPDFLIQLLSFLIKLDTSKS